MRYLNPYLDELFSKAELFKNVDLKIERNDKGIDISTMAQFRIIKL